MPKNLYDRCDSHSTSTRRSLPGLHDVLGDVLQQPLHGSASPRPYPDSRESTPHYSPRRAYYSSRAPSPHPLPHHDAPRGHPLPPPLSAPRNTTPAPPAPVPSGAPQHAYHLFNYSPHHGLVHQRTATQEQDLEPAHPRPRLPPSDPSRKHVCADCGNRFSKHSTLRNHLLTHSGEKPFECTHPGCGRRFSMACNMQRHMRTHTSASAFADANDGDDDEHGTSTPTPTYTYTAAAHTARSRMPSTQPSSRGGSRGSSRAGSPRSGGGAEDSRAYYHYR